MERFVDKIAVVTGAAYGLGDAISKELLRKGLIVVGIDRDINKLQVNFKTGVVYLQIVYTIITHNFAQYYLISSLTN